jgi:hypothetical protein
MKKFLAVLLFLSLAQYAHAAEAPKLLDGVEIFNLGNGYVGLKQSDLLRILELLLEQDEQLKKVEKATCT